ncbi:MAG: hypothetical protein IT373_06380, partial [Polyangiaceae bacterium]|nr:hypothetical protein [Polyangiaceae bacterium]
MSTERARRVRWTELARVAALALLVLVGPTVGDVGSCGQAVVELDARKFFDEKRGLDCAACSRCGYDGARCLAACA